MKRLTIMFVAAMLYLFSIVNYAGAALHDRGGGLIYDDSQNITWLQNANLAGSTMDWETAISWADSLLIQGYDDWRLPYTDTSCSGYDCTGSEMGHMFYTDLVTSDTPGLFTDVRPFMYWTANEDDTDAASAWRFNFSSGYQGTSSKTIGRWAWAVRDGDSAPPVVPEPVSSILFIIGGATLGLRSIRKRQKEGKTY